MPPNMRDDLLVWIDLEMTGLDIDNCSIIEIATVLTDGNLNIIAEGPNLAIQCSEDELSAMDEWNTSHHNASGLVERVRNSDDSMSEAESATLEFLEEYCVKGSAPLCGNSVWNDRRFLSKDMPQLDEFLHYRLLDVSSIKILAKSWYPELGRYPKKGAHLARDDILESIEELRYYRNHIFIDHS